MKTITLTVSDDVSEDYIKGVINNHRKRKLRDIYYAINSLSIDIFDTFEGGQSFEDITVKGALSLMRKYLDIADNTDHMYEELYREYNEKKIDFVNRVNEKIEYLSSLEWEVDNLEVHLDVDQGQDNS